MGKELEIGKRYEWDDIVNAYPGKWVRMNDCTFGWGNSIVDGTLAGIYNDGDPKLEDIRIEILRGRNDKTQNDRIWRTESGMSVGIIDCLNARMEVRDEP